MSQVVGELKARWAAFKDTIIWKAIVQQRGWVAAYMFVGLMLGGSVLGVIDTLRKIFDNAIVDRKVPLDPLVGLLVFYAVSQSGWGLATRMVGSRLAYQLEYSVRSWLYQRLQAIDPRSLDGLATGQMMTRAMTDLGFLMAIILVLPAVAPLLIFGMAILVIMLIWSWPLTLLTLGALPVNYFIVRRIVRRLWGLSWVALNRRAEVSVAIDEPVRGVRVVKTFGREEFERGRVRAAATGAFAVAMTRVRLLAKYGIPLKSTPIVFSAGLVFLGGRIAAGGHLTVGRFVIFLGLSLVFTVTAASFDEIVSAWQFAKTGAGRIFEMVALARPESSEPGAELAPPSTGLVLSDVGLAVPGAPRLSGVSVTVGHGELVAVTGPPGSGTSAVARLAAGELEPAEGAVLLDGTLVGAVDRRLLRQEVRLLLEDPFLFGRSVRENLLMGAPPGHPDVGEDQLHAALWAAGADEVVAELPGGLEETLGDRGMTLSGGQRQRLALARALVVPPRMLVLDEALSAVNPSFEVDILRRVREHAPGTGILCISRRDGPLMLADRIVELPDATSPSVATAPDPLAVLFSAPRGDLAAAVSELPPDLERPPVSEEAGTASDAAPTVMRTLEPLLGKVVQATLALFVVTLVLILPEALLKFAVDGVRHHSHHASDWVAVSFIPIAAGLAVANYFLRIFIVRVNESVLYVLRRRTFQRLSRLGIDYYDRNLPGEVASRVVYDLDRVAEFVDNGVYRVSTMLALLFVTLAVVFVWSRPVFFTVLPFVPVMLVLTAVQVPIADRAYRRARDTLGAVIARLHEDYSGRYVIAGYGGEQRASDDFMAIAWELRQARRWSTSVTNVYLSVIELGTGLVLAAVVARAGHLALAGALSVGSMVALHVLVRAALEPIPALSDVLQNYLVARASFRTLADPFRAPILPVERPTARPCVELAGAVDVDGINFAYPGTGRRVLHDISLSVAAGEVLAVVGPTGAGKSSVAKLLARVYDPDEGAVRVDGTDVRDLELTSYRRRLGVVPQDAFCFRGTVASNVAFGRPEATTEQVAEAVRAVGGDDALGTLPQGLDSVVEEEGRNLTPVQRQLVALARAWLVEPDVLVLDEATSNLSPALEAEVLDAVTSLGRTTIVITHRLSVAARADRVVVIEGGRIVEVGEHARLLEAGGRYSHLWVHGADGALAGVGAAGRGAAANGRRRRRPTVDGASSVVRSGQPPRQVRRPTRRS